MSVLYRGLASVMLIAASLEGWAGPFPLLGKPAPDFALRAYVGDNVRLSEHRGEVVVVSFWGSRCSVCAAQLATLDRSLKTYRSAGLSIYGVAIDDDASRAQEFAQAQRLGFPLLKDPRKSVGRLYQVDVLPMTLLIDRGGTVRYVHRDYDVNGDSRYLNELRELLNE